MENTLICIQSLLIWTFWLYDHLLVRACSDKWLQAYFTPKLKIIVTLLSWYEPRVFIDCLCSIVTIVTPLPWLMAWYGCIVLTSYTRYDKILWLCLEWYTLSLNGLYSCTEYLRAIYGKYFEFLGLVVWLCLVVIAHINCFKDSCVKRHCVKIIHNSKDKASHLTVSSLQFPSSCHPDTWHNWLVYRLAIGWNSSGIASFPGLPRFLFFGLRSV